MQAGVLIGLDWVDSIDAMSDRDAGQLLKALLHEASGHDPVVPSGAAARVLWPKMLKLQQTNRAHYAEICAKRQAAAVEKWRREHENGLHSSKPIQVDTKSMQIDANASGSIPNTNTNTKSSNELIPPIIPPLGDGVDRGKDKKNRTQREREEIARRWLERGIGRYYGRKRTTAWSDKELRKLVQLARRPDALREWQAIRRLYRSGYEYYRRDIPTLLNNWTGELDRTQKAVGSRSGKTAGGTNETKYANAF